MLRITSELLGYTVHATDGDVGKVHDLLFDDQTWTVRYMVCNTGTWLAERLVLIAPEALEPPAWQKRAFPVALQREQVEQSPPIDLAEPVSRQQEEALRLHYNWPVYWPLEPGVAPVAVPVQARLDEDDDAGEAPSVSGDPHLRSVREVTDYRIRAQDGDCGHVADFVLDDVDWLLRYLVVDTRNWLPGKKVLVAAPWIAGVDWAAAQVGLDMPRQRLADSPPFDPSAPLNRSYEERLYDFHGRPRYWR